MGKIIFKFYISISKLIFPLLARVLIAMRINRRLINYLSEKSFFANEKYNFSKIIDGLLQNKKIIALDVGAQGGFNSDNFFSKKYNSFFEPIMIEPIKEEYEKLKKNYKYVLNKALWSGEEIKKIYILGKRLGSSSMYDPDSSAFNVYGLKEKESEKFRVTSTVEVECETLDNGLKKINIQKLDYLKLDTQGSELEILKGMKDYNPLLIRLEVQIFSMYKNVPPWTELVDFLNKKKYMITDWKEIGKHNSRVPAEMDMVFIPNYRSSFGKDLIINNEKKFTSLMLIFGQLNLLKIIAQELGFKSKDTLLGLNDRYFY